MAAVQGIEALRAHGARPRSLQEIHRRIVGEGPVQLGLDEAIP
jgi:hypothetical protein